MNVCILVAVSEVSGQAGSTVGLFGYFHQADQTESHVISQGDDLPLSCGP